MPKKYKPSNKKNIFILIVIGILCLLTTYTLINKFIFNNPFEKMNDSTNKINEKTTLKRANEKEYNLFKFGDIFLGYNYEDENIKINIERVKENEVTYFVADVEISHINYFKSAFAKDTFGKDITETTSTIAKNNNAIFAVNGDFYGCRDTGLVIRNGILHRDEPRVPVDNLSVTVNKNGSLGIVEEGSVSGESLVENGVLQSFSFGPVLVQNGEALGDISGFNAWNGQPRTAIGEISPLHYIFVVVDGRQEESVGMSLDELAQIFVKRGAVTAYNLDGGGSSTMWFRGNVVNNPTDGFNVGERSVSEIIYIGK